MIRRYGEPFQPGQRYRRRPGVYAVILQGGSLLATHQAEPVPEFQLPGGGSTAESTRSPRFTARCSRKPAGASR